MSQATSGQQVIPTVVPLNEDLFFGWSSDQTGQWHVFGRILDNTTISAMINLPSPSLSPTSSWVSTTQLSSTAVPPSSAMSTTFSSSGIGSSELSDELSSDASRGATNNNVAYIAGGTAAGGVAILVGGILIKVCCFSKDKEKSVGSQVELAEGIAGSQSSIKHSDHRTFIGVSGSTYEIWDWINRKEAKKLDSRTLRMVPPVDTSQTIRFELGKGKASTIFAGSDFQSSEMHAVKEVNGNDAVAASLHENELVASLDEHPFVMNRLDYQHIEANFEETSTMIPARYYQVMPLAYTDGKGISWLLNRVSKELREQLVADSFGQLMKGLKFLHSQKVAYLSIDCRSEFRNILYMTDGTLKISDFGCAMRTDDDDQIRDVTGLEEIVCFTPELLKIQRNSSKASGEELESCSSQPVDVWTAGLFIWELLDSEGNNLDALRTAPLRTAVGKFNDHYFDQLLQRLRLLEDKYSEDFLQALNQALTVNPDRRVSAANAVKQLGFAKMTSQERSQAFDQLKDVVANPNKYATGDYMVLRPM